MIVQHQVTPANPFPKPGIDTSVVDPLDRDVRADQLMFVRQRGTELPTTPANDSQFTSTGLGSETQYVRVWYGHALRTNDNGTDPGGAVDLDVTKNPVFLDRSPTSWILGRQGLFLRGAPNASSPLLPDIYAQGGWVNAPLAGGMSGPATLLYNGATDVADFALLKSNQSTSFGSMVADDTAGSNNTGQVLAATLNAADYRTRAATEYTFARFRLRVNDRPPSTPPPPPAPQVTNYFAWEIAQMHAIMAEGSATSSSSSRRMLQNNVTGVPYLAGAVAPIVDGEIDRVKRGGVALASAARGIGDSIASREVSSGTRR